MRAFWIAMAAICCAAASSARADQTIASAQQTLKDQGFYYGEITGTKDADTVAAIRRYQIRNGLKITGDLSAETQKSLGLHGDTPSAATPAPQRQQSVPPAPQNAPPDTSDLRADQETVPGFAPGQRGPGLVTPPTQQGDAAAPGAYAATPGLFNGTPYQLAPGDVQRQVIIGAQKRLAQRGYYRSNIDGEFGAGTAFALRAFQTQFRLPPTGRFDMQTLAALGLLPGQRAPGMAPPGRRIYRPYAVPPERLYVPQ